ncbi:hypothetical protein KFZ76_07195 [Methylovulum psychrotolerans]|uniref:hypothetical protein n=1 Tax=Methylovulum psychrotolerans TaxID=1704499 RepID=UPI001BFEFB1E|nr:hypothetical protein [Methylovulum psychrotolerans]MBT9097497.1 hypothetical protein [Methylovulum psychrotolerans]
MSVYIFSFIRVIKKVNRGSKANAVRRNPVRLVLYGNPTAGADGARKVRWSVEGKGKRGGVRVIYFNLTGQGMVVLVTLYLKADRDNIAEP